jgi:hypothetical protein
MNCTNNHFQQQQNFFDSDKLRNLLPKQLQHDTATRRGGDRRRIGIGRNRRFSHNSRVGRSVGCSSCMLLLFVCLFVCCCCCCLVANSCMHIYIARTACRARIGDVVRTRRSRRRRRRCNIDVVVVVFKCLHCLSLSLSLSLHVCV